MENDFYVTNAGQTNISLASTGRMTSVSTSLTISPVTLPLFVSSMIFPLLLTNFRNKSKILSKQVKDLSSQPETAGHGGETLRRPTIPAPLTLNSPGTRDSCRRSRQPTQKRYGRLKNFGLRLLAIRSPPQWPTPATPFETPRRYIGKRTCRRILSKASL